ncbi:MAG: MotA/TolQ/ExbB proton channel family protein [Candidatus Azobacteroides sp.]|nr:MotA/TolQ/ExbB proton channel family protein [Candidatus Azobacteroides sp.]
METKQGKQQGQKPAKKSRGISAGIVILVCAIIAVLFYIFWLGRGANFVNGDPSNNPLPGNYWGTVYKGGANVCIVMTLLLTVIALSIERFFAINKAKGTSNLVKFVANVKAKLEVGDIDGAQSLCSKQKGSVASVVSSGLRKYSEVENTTEDISKDQKLLAIQKEIEEATALELPTMEQNLPVVAAISTLGTLFGLLGTVLGMIRSFAALANEGAPDSVALATGISEALVNTALGIATGALAIISYNYYTGKIDNITYAIDETGFSIVQTYAEKHK